MSLCSRSLLSKLCGVTTLRNLSTVTQLKVVPEEQFKTFRTTECNPMLHTSDHLGKYYTIPEAVRSKLFKYGGLPTTFTEQVETFRECALLIRNPALEIMSYLTQADYERPINKYILYGKFGTGKSLTLAHLLHYAFMCEFIIIHISWVNLWFRFAKEVTPSQEFPGHVDIAIEAGQWLITFQNHNDKLLSKLDLKISKTYEWSAREQTVQGTSLKELVSFGINRVKFATQVINVLIDELKMASTAGKCKTFVAIDGYNSFWSDYTNVLDDDKKMISAQKITLTKPFLNVTKADWCNGAAVLVLDQRATNDRRESHLPRYLLGKEGFEFLDPFVPIAVEKYTSKEFYTVINYYKDRKWIRSINPEGELEIELLSGRNPFKVLEYCNPL